MSKFEKVLSDLIIEANENVRRMWHNRSVALQSDLMAQYWQDRRQTLLEVQQLLSETKEN